MQNSVEKMVNCEPLEKCKDTDFLLPVCICIWNEVCMSHFIAKNYVKTQFLNYPYETKNVIIASEFSWCFNLSLKREKKTL